MKIIKVNCCGNCPMKSFLIKDGKVLHCCYGLSVEGTTLERMDTIHPDCHLEDYEKGE